MAMSLEEFIKATGAELVCDRLIVGMLGERRFVGDVMGGTFTLNEDGQELVAALETGTPVKPRRTRAPAAEPEAPAE